MRYTRALLIFTAVCVLAVVAWVLMRPIIAPSPSVSTLSSFASEAPIPMREVQEGYKEYATRAYNFSLLYPSAMEVSEFPDSGGQTITFEDATDKENLEGFQIYATLYTDPGVTQEFVKRYVPDAHTFENITVDGAPGVAFVSTDIALGETREVWFARGKVLYQAATPRPLELVLRKALESWKFI